MKEASSLSDLIMRVSPALLAFFLGTTLQTIKGYLSANTSLISDHIDDLDKLMDRVERYWLSQEDWNKRSTMAAEVRISEVACLQFFFHAESLLKSRHDDYLELMTQLLQTATGGDFEVNYFSSETDTNLGTELIVRKEEGRLSKLDRQKRAVHSGHIVASMMYELRLSRIENGSFFRVTLYWSGRFYENHIKQSRNWYVPGQ